MNIVSQITISYQPNERLPYIAELQNGRLFYPYAEGKTPSSAMNNLIKMLKENYTSTESL